MKRTALAPTFIFALSLISGAKGVQFDYSQFEGWPNKPPIVSLVSPSQNATYSVPDIPLNVTVQIRGYIFHNIERIRWLNYSLDGQTTVPLTLIVPSMYDISIPYPVYGNDMLTDLSDGSHNLTIFGETFISGLNGYFNETVFFTVDTSYMPAVEPVPVSLLFVASVGFDIAVIGILSYFKKSKRQNVKTKKVR